MEEDIFRIEPGTEYHINQAKYDKIFYVGYSSKSEELALLRRVTDSKKFDDEMVFNKLFFSYEDKQKQGESKEKEYYLKNKYLFLTTKGIVSYLQLRGRIDSEFSRFEIETVSKRIVELFKRQHSKKAVNSEKLNIISLGSADSRKEIAVFKELFKNEEMSSMNIDIKKNLSYCQVDSSPTLIQLGLNNFTSDETFENVEVKSFVSDIWHLTELVQKRIEKKKTGKSVGLKIDNDLKSQVLTEVFGEGARLFLVLGGTFGSYNERELLQQVSKLMGNNDRIMISMKLKEAPKDEDDALFENPDFLLSPLAYLPYYYGFTRYPKRFLKPSADKTRLVDINSAWIEEDTKKIILAMNRRYNKDFIQAYLNALDDYIEFSDAKFDSNSYYAVLTGIKRRSKNNTRVKGQNQLKLLMQSKDSKPRQYERAFTSINQAVTNRLYEMKFFSRSEELSFLNQLGSYDASDYGDKKVFYKLFNHYGIRDRRTTSDYYLKNKYLYVTTTGILNYLRLYNAQKKTLYDFFEFEKNELREILLEFLNETDNNQSLNLVSLGAAISDKEAEVLKEIFENNNYRKRIKYYPVDISSMLLQLGLNNLSKEKLFADFEVNPVVADFWSLADYIRLNNPQSKPNEIQKKREKRAVFFGKGKRLFILLGGTFGNYTEREFLDQVIELMDENDELMISVKLQQEDGSYTPDKDYKNLPGNRGFLLEPLKFIPLYYGYSRFLRDSLVTSSKANLDYHDDELKFVSVVPKSECTAPYLDVDKAGKESQRARIRLCWSTRYNSEELKSWMVNTFISKDKEHKFEYCQDRKGNVWYHKVRQENCFAVMRLRKVKTSYYDDIMKLTEDCSLEMDKDYELIIEKLRSMSNKLDKDTYNMIKCELSREKSRKQLKRILNEIINRIYKEEP
ncbi:MAG: hypothetical protein VZR53_08970 [Prevotella sp.]|nr:hypothetical protein [Prevotella sp.]